MVCGVVKAPQRRGFEDSPKGLPGQLALWGLCGSCSQCYVYTMDGTWLVPGTLLKGGVKGVEEEKRKVRRRVEEEEKGAREGRRERM